MRWLHKRQKSRTAQIGECYFNVTHKANNFFKAADKVERFSCPALLLHGGTEVKTQMSPIVLRLQLPEHFGPVVPNLGFPGILGLKFLETFTTKLCWPGFLGFVVQEHLGTQGWKPLP